MLLSYLPGWWLLAGSGFFFTLMLSWVYPWAELLHFCGGTRGETGKCEPGSPRNFAASRAQIQPALPSSVYYNVFSCYSGLPAPSCRQKAAAAAWGSGISDIEHHSCAFSFPWLFAELFLSSEVRLGQKCWHHESLCMDELGNCHIAHQGQDPQRS